MPPLLESDSADQALVGTLSERFRPSLLRYFRRRRLPEKDLEDATQEVFVRLSRRRGLAGMGNPAGYLFQTAASVAIDQQRYANARRTAAHQSYDDQSHAIADHAPDELLEARESLGLLHSGLLELPERTRNVFILARFEHMRQAEIARRMGISVSAVEKHILRAMTYLVERVRRAP